jgi:ribosomal protein L37AE/L43A
MGFAFHGSPPSARGGRFHHRPSPQLRKQVQDVEEYSQSVKVCQDTFTDIDKKRCGWKTASNNYVWVFFN